MKLIIFSSSPNPVGVAKNSLSLATSLKKRGVDASILCLNTGWLVEAGQRDSIDAVALSYNSTLFSLIKNNVLVYKHLRSNTAHVVHLNGRATLFCCMLSLLCHRKVRYIYSVRQFEIVGRPGILSWKNKLEVNLMRLSSIRIHAVSRALADETERRIKHKKVVRYIPNFILGTPKKRVDRMADGGRQGRSEFRLLYVGRLSPEKGVDVLILAIKYIFDQKLCPRSSLSLDLVGDGPLKASLSEAIQQYDLGSIVTLQGPDPLIRRKFKDYDAVVIPSRSESFGLVAIEAFYEGLPVVASNVPGLSDVVMDAAVVFDSEDYVGLAHGILRLLSTPSLLDECIDKGHRQALQYSEGCAVGEFLDLYEAN